MIDFVNVGNKISTLRKQNNLTQDDLADKLFVTRQALSKWEQGQSIPSIDTIITLSKIFNVSFEELLCMNDEITIDKNNIFSGHSRYFIIDQIIQGKLRINLSEYFYLFSDDERMQILKAIKDEKLFIHEDDMKDLIKKLTRSELKFIGRLQEVIYEIEENNDR